MIKEEARRLGFDGCGISRAAALKEDAVYLDGWLKNHYHAGMDYNGRRTI
jgi:epoxyqueuosine reductase